MRSALASLPPADVAAAQVAASAKPDAELLQLGEAFSAAWAQQIEAGKALDLAAPKNDDDPLWVAHDALMTATSDIVAKIEALQATTLAGLVVKARACHWCHSGEPVEDDFFSASDNHSTDDRLGAGILRDLLALDPASDEPGEASTKAIVAAVQAAARDDAALLALRDEWLDRHAANQAALDVFEFTGIRRLGATDTQKAAARHLAEMAFDALDDIADRALAIPARTARGIAFKIEISKEFANDREDITRAILADLAALEAA